MKTSSLFLPCVLFIFGSAFLIISMSYPQEPSQICVTKEDVLKFKKKSELTGLKRGIIFSIEYIHRSCAVKGEVTLTYRVKGKKVTKRIICRPAKQI